MWTYTKLIEIVIGTALLTMGRRMFWLFVGAAGFILCSEFTIRFPIGGPEWAPLVVSLLAGFIGAILAIFVQKLAVAVGGFILGSYTLASIAFSLGIETTHWITLVVGGVIGSLLVLAVFDWALIVLSSMAGAMLIVQSGLFEHPVNILVFLIMLSVGIAIQTHMFKS